MEYDDDDISIDAFCVEVMKNLILLVTIWFEVGIIWILGLFANN
jgi:hypothetical protein